MAVHQGSLSAGCPDTLRCDVRALGYPSGMPQLAKQCHSGGTTTPQSYAVRDEPDETGEMRPVVYCTTCRTRTASKRGARGAFMFNHSGFIDWDDHPLGGRFGADLCLICDKPVRQVGVFMMCPSAHGVGTYRPSA